MFLFINNFHHGCNYLLCVNKTKPNQNNKIFKINKYDNAIGLN